MVHTYTFVHVHVHTPCIYMYFTHGFIIVYVGLTQACPSYAQGGSMDISAKYIRRRVRDRTRREAHTAKQRELGLQQRRDRLSKEKLNRAERCQTTANEFTSS